MFTCTVIRHAAKQSGNFFNPALRHQDEPISERGVLQSQQLIPYFNGKTITAMYISEYQRTAQTIAPLAEKFGITPVVDPRLNEIDNGYLDDMSEEEVQERYPEFWKVYIARTEDFRFPGGETGAEVRQRVLDFLTEKRRQHPDGHVLAVAHDGLMRQLACVILDLPVTRRAFFWIDYCGITEVGYEEEYSTWRLMRWNQVCG